MTMQVSAELLEILVCPDEHHSALTADNDGDDFLCCPTCGRRYPIRDGIPMLLLDGTERAADGVRADPS